MPKPKVEPRVPMEQWAKDHWEALAYVENCTVDRGGKIHKLSHLRVNPVRHPSLVGVHHLRSGSAPDEYPTRLRDGEVEHDHDDWDCIRDMRDAGLLKVTGLLRDCLEVEPGQRGLIDLRGPMRHSILGSESKRVIRFTLTASGIAMAAAVRKHKTEGGVFATFVPPGDA